MPPKSVLNKNALLELGVIIFASLLIFIVSGFYDLLENLIEFLHRYEEYEIDEMIMVSLFLVVALSFFSLRRWQDTVAINRDLEKSNQDLRTALSEIKQLKAIIPICSSCRKLMDDDGSWQQLEAYFADHTDTQLSHGICPDCAKKLYPEIDLTQKDP